MDVLATLDQQGAFEIRRSVEMVSRRLGISKVTAYAYLDELRKAAS
jgi:predicted transcriptional regulator YheO